MSRKLLLLPALLLAIVYSGFSQAPVANAVVTPLSGCPPLGVSFVDNSTNKPTSWLWSTPGGTPASGTTTNFATIYNAPGTYTATLKATNAFGSSTYSVQIVVNPVPLADFTQDFTDGCYPTWINFTDKSSAGGGGVITSYLWDFGDGNQSNKQSPSHRYTSGGSFPVTLYVKNNFGCTGQAQVKNVQKAITLTGGVFPNFTSALSTSCALPVTANFTNTSSGPPILNWNWDFGDGTPNSNLFSPSHSYTAAGAYIVRLAATHAATINNAGCSDTLSRPVNISANGNLTDFSYSDTVCVNTPVNFTNISSPKPNSSDWDYGDGFMDLNRNNGLHTYTTTGTFPVTLKNTFFGCTGTITKNIVVLNPPTVTFTGTGLTSCQPPLTSSFTNTSVGGTTWLWDFGDGTTSTLKNPPPHTYTTYGNFQVSLTASIAGGCATTLAQPGFVKVQKPIVSINGLPAFGCAPYNITPTATATTVDGVASYNWIFGNGNTSTSATPPMQSYPAGNFTVTLSILTTGGCSANASGQVTVGSIKPTANFTFTPPTACAGSPVQFKDGSSPGTNKWLWDFGNGSTDNTQNPIYPFPAAGTWNVRLTAYNNGCWDTISRSIVINGPAADFKFSSVCGAKNTYNFTDNSTGVVTGYLWDFGDGTTSTVQNPSHPYAGPPKTYTVTLTVTNSAFPCSNTKSYQVSVGQVTTISFSANPVCANTNIFLTAIPAGNIVSYTFKLGDGNSITGGSASIGYTYSKPGNYPVKVITTDNTGCIDSSAVDTMFVNGPTANFKAPPALTCGALTYTYKDLSTPSAGSSIVKWAWDFGDGTTSSLPNPPAHTYSNQGNFIPTLTVTDNNGCSSTLDTIKAITVSIPIASFTISDTMSCPAAPNPILFNNTSTGFNPVYTWDFGDGTKVTGGPISPIYAYSTVGNFPVKLSMTDFYGCKASKTFPLPIIVDTPHAAFTMSGNYSACPPFNVTFTFTGQYAKSYNWIFDNGGGSTARGPNNSLYANPGDYYPYLSIVSWGGCTSKADTQHIHIDGPVGTFTYSPLAGCDSLDVLFKVTTTNVVSFKWNFGDGQLQTTSTPTITHRYVLPNQYIPIVTLTDAAGCVLPKIGTSPINVDAITKTIFTADKTIVCDSGIVNFTNTSILANGTFINSYSWDFGDGSPLVVGLFPNPSHNYTTIGNYTAKLTIGTVGGCTGTYTMPITVAGKPNVAINGLISQCEPAILNFQGVEVITDPNGPLAWSWDFGNGQNSNVQNPAPVSYPKAGEYIVQLIATNKLGCKDTTNTAPPSHLFIYPIPTVEAGSDVTICDTSKLQLNATGNATTYDWDPPVKGNLNCLKCANPVATSPSSTYFVVKGTTLQGCTARDTIQVTVNTPVTVTATGTGSVCLGQSAILNATGAAIYTWTPAQGLDNPNIANPVATPVAAQIGNASSAVITYSVTGYDNLKCYSDTKSINVTAYKYPAIGMINNATIHVGSSYQINATVTTNIVSLNWTPSNTLSCANCLTPLATPTKTTKYVLAAVNDGGCTTTDSIRIQVICDGANFFVPNTFSPNGDGVNDYFIINGVGLNVIPSITIYNRWGQIVFQKSNFAPNTSSSAWDGTFNGQPAPPDVYIYTLQILCNNATLIPFHGNVTLIR